jgi:predicted nucleic acid-binding protein
MIYVDSSFILSYLLKDVNYSFAKKIIESESLLWSSDLLRFECIVTFYKKYPSGEKTKFNILQKIWENINLVKVNDSILEILNQEPMISQLRTLDSIHVATCISIQRANNNSHIQLASFYKRMIELAIKMNLSKLE